MGKTDAGSLLSWDFVSGATGSDIVRGTLSDLRSGGGDFSTSTDECLDDNRTTTSLLFTGTPAAGDAFWFLVRGQNCGGNATHDSGGGSQVDLRDTEIAGSGNDCL